MNIKLNNFGIIKNADIGISPLNIFIGSNSSGKSFAARLIHCFNCNDVPNIDEELFGYLDDCLKENDDINKKLFDYIQTQPKLNSQPLKIPFDEIQPMINEVVLKYLSNVFQFKIEEEFDLSLNDLINSTQSYFKLDINDCEFIKKYNESFEFKTASLTINEKVNTAKIALDFDSDSNLLINIESMLFNITKLTDVNSLLLIILTMIANSIFRDICLKNSYYLIAERSDLVTDSKALTRRIQDRSYFSKNQIDILSKIYSIDPAQKGEFYDLGCDFDKEFSGYLVEVKDNGINNDITYVDEDTSKEVSSKMLSTSIHEMALLSIYLKYVVKKEDLLIIEEPEAHLHPKNQRILVKYLVRAVNNGLKVMITTHSDYVIEQFNNFVRLNSISQDCLDQFNYSQEDVLNHGDISIYTFKKDSKKQYIAEKIDINETGFDEETFSPISEELYDESDKIIDMM